MTKRVKIKRSKIVSSLLVLCMLASLVGTTVLADTVEQPSTESGIFEQLPEDSTNLEQLPEVKTPIEEDNTLSEAEDTLPAEAPLPEVVDTLPEEAPTEDAPEEREATSLQIAEDDIYTQLATLQDGQALRIELSGDTTLTHPLRITASNANVTLVGSNATLTQPAAQPHIMLDGADATTLAFEGVLLRSAEGGEGGLAVLNSNGVTITGLDVQGASGHSYGGVLLQNSNVEIHNALVQGNTAVSTGGGVTVQGGSLRLVNSRVLGNKALSTQRNVHAFGGGIALLEGAALTLHDSHVGGNTALAPQTSHYSYGGGIYVAADASLTLTGNVLVGGENAGEGNRAVYGGGIYLAAGNAAGLTLGMGVRIAHNRAEGNYNGFGGGVYLGDGTALAIEGAALTYNYGYDGGAVYGGKNVSVTLRTGAIDHNECKRQGGGVSIDEGSSFTMYDGSINYNRTWQNAAAIEAHYINSVPGTSTIALYGGEIAYNRAEGTNSGVGAIYGNTVLVDGVDIHHNTMEMGQRVAINAHSIEMHSGYIRDNVVELANFGSSMVLGAIIGCDHFTMAGGEITGNKYLDSTKSVYGTVFVSLRHSNESSLLMTGGLIADNVSEHGGAIAYMSDGYVSFFLNNGKHKAEILGGEIRDNVAHGSGGALFLGTFPTTIGGDAVISGNEAEGSTAGGFGGAIYKMGGSLVLQGNARMENNTALKNGGAIFSYMNGDEEDDAIFVQVTGNAVLAGNSTGASGGGVYISHYGGEGPEADKVLFDGNAQILNNTAANNGGGYAGEWLSALYAGENVTFSGNSARRSYALDDEDIELYESRVSATSFTAPFANGYNNYDIMYIWGRVNMNVRYELNYEGAGVYKIGVVPQGDKLESPVDPTRSGYSFTGWYLDDTTEVRWDFATPVEADTTLHAGWKENETVTPPTTSGSESGSSSSSTTTSGGGGSTTSSSSTTSGSTTTSGGSTSSSPEGNGGDGGAGGGNGGGNNGGQSTTSQSTSRRGGTSTTTTSRPQSSAVSSSAVSSAPQSSAVQSTTTSQPEREIETEIPAANLQTGQWALLNLLLLVASLVLAVTLLVLLLAGRFQQPLRYLPGIAGGIAALVVFLLTQNMALPMVMADGWTWLMLALALAQTLLLVLARRSGKNTRGQE